jgi:hypothetical protein
MDMADEQLIAEECQADPTFCARVQATLALPDGVQRLSVSARKAVVNELNPMMYPEMAGTWNRLREAIRSTIASLSDQVAIPVVSKAVMKGLGNLGQDIGSILGPIVSALANAGSAIYVANLQANTAKQIQQSNLNAQMSMIRAQQSAAAAQQAEANAQMAQTGAPGQIATATSNVSSAISSVTDTLSQPIGGTGIPTWAVLLAFLFFAKPA